MVKSCWNCKYHMRKWRLWNICTEPTVLERLNPITGKAVSCSSARNSVCQGYRWESGDPNYVEPPPPPPPPAPPQPQIYSSSTVYRVDDDFFRRGFAASAVTQSIPMLTMAPMRGTNNVYEPPQMSFHVPFNAITPKTMNIELEDAWKGGGGEFNGGGASESWDGGANDGVDTGDGSDGGTDNG